MSNAELVKQVVLNVPALLPWQEGMRLQCAEAAAKAVAQIEQAAEQAVTANAGQPSTLPDDTIIIRVEDLAAYAHEAWAGWMRYMFRFCTDNEDGTVTMDAEKVARWKRQMSTEYADLPESEKASDRNEARKILDILFPGQPVELPF